jgi:amino acid transporter
MGLAALITCGITGQLGAWLSGSARVPFAIGLDRYLPPAFARLHPRWKTPHVAILTQGSPAPRSCSLCSSGKPCGPVISFWWT